MQLVNEFSVPATADDAWSVLSDIERIVSCIPGARLEGRDGDAYLGSVDVKVGPVALSFGGKATVLELDPDVRRMVVRGAAEAGRGQGAVGADIAMNVLEGAGESTVRVVTDLALSGKVAQFGSGMITQVNRRIIGEFTSRLDSLIRTGVAPEPAPLAPAPLGVDADALVQLLRRASDYVAGVVGGALFGWALSRAIRSASGR